jgi:hypothetical protein
MGAQLPVQLSLLRNWLAHDAVRFCSVRELAMGSGYVTVGAQLEADDAALRLT